MIALWYFFPVKAGECKTGAPSTSLTWTNIPHTPKNSPNFP